MRKVVFLLVAMLCVTMLFSQQKRVSMYNEVAVDATMGGYDVAMPSALFSYTGGVNAGKYFSTGVTLGYDPWREQMLWALKLKGLLPLEKVHFYASASGGIRTTFEEACTSVSFSAGVGIKSRKHIKNSFNIGPVLELVKVKDKKDWAPLVGIRLGYQF